MKKIAKENFLELQQYLKDNFDLQLLPTTAYRGEIFQKTLYDNYVKNYGKESADTFSARPGYSEHQTGLAIDVGFIKDGLHDPYFNVDDYNMEFKWLRENSYKYGFILRYPLGKENITGYKYEPCLYRYIGNLANYLYKNNKTLEEFFNVK